MMKVKGKAGQIKGLVEGFVKKNPHQKYIDILKNTNDVYFQGTLTDTEKEKAIKYINDEKIRREIGTVESSGDSKRVELAIKSIKKRLNELEPNGGGKKKIKKKHSKKKRMKRSKRKLTRNHKYNKKKSRKNGKSKRKC